MLTKPLGPLCENCPDWISASGQFVYDSAFGEAEWVRNIRYCASRQRQAVNENREEYCEGRWHRAPESQEAKK